VEPCALGCNIGASECREIVPSNGATREQLEGVTAELRAPTSGTLVIDTESGEIINAGDRSVVRAAGEGVNDGIFFDNLDNGIAVFGVDTLSIDRDGALVADGLNALLVLSRGDVKIEGRIIMSACCQVDDLSVKVDPDDSPGPGGSFGAVAGMFPAEGCAPGKDGTSPAAGGDETGGGGGGLGSDGAPGGIGSLGTEPGAGGDVPNDTCPGPSLVPLKGGSGGGAGAGASGGAGGAGGGAIQITSFTRIIMSGLPTSFVQGILASGGGGGPGDDTSGGGGGGSGGAILLEAPSLEIGYMVLTANGGGGGGSGDATEARAGQLGRSDGVQAAGGLGARAGGRGGALNGGSTIGAGGEDGTGGGGGGVGIIRFNVPSANLKVENSNISPAHTRGDPQTR
jgi:hypothetical protein